MYTVKQTASRSEVTVDTIRYYSRLGIISPQRNPENGYRYFSDSDVRLIKFIRKAKYYGLTIQEIREVLDKSSAGESPCQLVTEMVKQRLHETRKNIRELQALDSRLAQALNDWEAMDSTQHNSEMICPLIEHEKDIKNKTH